MTTAMYIAVLSAGARSCRNAAGLALARWLSRSRKKGTGRPRRRRSLLPKPKPLLSVGDRVEIYWSGEGEHFAGTVVRIKEGRVEVVYDDGDEGSYDMEREVWRVEGGGRWSW